MRLTTGHRILVGALAIAATAAGTASARPNLQSATSRADATTRASAIGLKPDQQAGPPARVPLAVKEAAGLAAMNRAKTHELAVLADQAPAGASYTRLFAAVHPTALTAPTIKTPGHGFDYGDAAVGAAITATIGLLITGRGLAIRQRSQRPQRASRSTATVTSAHDLHETGDLR